MNLRIFTFLFLLPVLGFAQQLPYRSVFNETGFVFNPAMTARFQFMEFGATYRQQWMGFTDAPSTATLNFQYPFPYQNMSVGAFVNYDRTNPLNYNAISFTYAYKFRLGIKRADQMSIGILGTLGEFHLDGSNILVNDADDSLIPGSESSRIQPNVGMGIFYQSYADGDFDQNFFFFGLGINQLLKSDLRFEDSSAPLNLRRSIHGNALIGVRLIYEDLFLEPSAWVNYAEQNLLNANAGIKLEKQNSFWTGLAYSSNSTVSFQAGVILKGGLLMDGTLRVGTLGTYNVGGNGNYQGFGYEFYIAYRFEQ